MSYRGIKELRGAGEKVDLTEERRAILKRCAEDPEYFIMNYYRVNNRYGEGQLLQDRPRQIAEISTLQNSRYIKGDWYRQSGFTTIVLAYFVWKAVFTPNAVLLYTAPKRTQVLEPFDGFVRNPIKTLPYWMQPGIEAWTEDAVVFGNGSRIVSDVTRADAFRGNSPEYIFIDNFGWTSDSKLVEIVATVLPTLKDSAKVHLVLGSAQRFGAHTEANTLFWKDCKMPFVISEYVWKAETDEEREFEREQRERIGDAAFEEQYIGRLPGSSIQAEEILKRIDTLPDIMRRSKWAVGFRSDKEHWKWLEEHFAVHTVETRQVEFNGREYLGLMLVCNDYEGYPVSGMDLGGIVDVDIRHFDWEYGKDAGTVRYRCLCLPSMVQAGTLTYMPVEKQNLETEVRLIVLDRCLLTEGCRLERMPKVSLDDMRKCNGKYGHDAISAWLDVNAVL